MKTGPSHEIQEIKCLTINKSVVFFVRRGLAEDPPVEGLPDPRLVPDIAQDRTREVHVR